MPELCQRKRATSWIVLEFYFAAIVCPRRRPSGADSRRRESRGKHSLNAPVLHWQSATIQTCIRLPRRQHAL